MIPYWVSVILVLTHVGMFALGVAAFQILRLVNARPIYGKPQPVSEQKIQQLAERIMQKQVAQNYDWMLRNGKGEIEEGVQAVTPKK